MKEIYTIDGTPLFKFQDKEKINSLRKGTLYAKTLKYYRDREQETGDADIGDEFEAMIHINKGHVYIPDTSEIYSLDDTLIRTIHSDDYVFCMFGILPNTKDFKFSEVQKEKVEFLCNECCWFDCYARKDCYENVSRKNLDMDCDDHVCVSPTAQRGYRFSDAINNPGFIGIDDIQKVYAPAGFRNFKIEGRSLGSAMILEFLLYYMTKPEHQLKVREEIYLSSSLDLF